MDEEQDAISTGGDEGLEREVRANRKFSLSEAIGRMAGGDLMKSASSVTRERQAELEIVEGLRCYMTDAGGALGAVLLRNVGESLLRCDYDQPLVLLADVGVRDLLDRLDGWRDEQIEGLREGQP